MTFNYLSFVIAAILCCLYSSSVGQIDLKSAEEKALKFQHINMDSSFYYWRIMERYALDQKDTARYHTAIHNLGSYYHINNNPSLAYDYSKKALALADHDTLKILAMVQCAMSSQETLPILADSFYQEAAILVEKIDRPFYYMTLYGNYGIFKIMQGDLHGAIGHMIKALDNVNHDYPKSTFCTNIADVFIRLDNYDKAEKYILQAIEILDKNNFKKRNEFAALVYARVLIENNDFQNAENEINRAIDYYSIKNNLVSLPLAHNVEFELFRKQKKWDLANQALTKAIINMHKTDDNFKGQILNNIISQHLRKNENQEVINRSLELEQLSEKQLLPFNKRKAYGYLSEAFAREGKIDLAYSYLSKYNELNDSLQLRNQEFLVHQMETEFNRKEQDLTINLLNENNELQANKLLQQKKLLIISLASLLLISALSWFLFQLFKKVQSQNKIVKDALNEKDILLREIHHRVKNNLQLVSSLLGLQSRFIEDRTALDAITSGQARVRSMALIHQDLYNRENLTGVSVHEYINKLCEELSTSYQFNKDQIKLKMDISELYLDIDTLIPLGLIINELLTNSFKYAFPDQSQKGIIEISLKEINQQLILMVSDNGIGYETDSISNISFGNQLIETLVEQLEGHIIRSNQNGTEVIIKIKEYKIAS